MEKGELWVEWRRTNHLVLVEITSIFWLGKTEHVEGIVVSGPKIGEKETWDWRMFQRRFKKLNMFNKEKI